MLDIFCQAEAKHKAEEPSSIAHTNHYSSSQASQSHPTTLLPPTAFAILANLRGCTLLSPEPVWETLLQGPRIQASWAQPAWKTCPASELNSSSAALSAHCLESGVKKTLPTVLFRLLQPFPSHCAIIHSPVLLSSFKFIFGLFSLQQKTFKLLSEITLIIFITNYPESNDGIKKKKGWLRKLQIWEVTAPLIAWAKQLIFTISSPLGSKTLKWLIWKALFQMLVLHHRRGEKCMERPSSGKEMPGAHRKKSFKGRARNKNDLEGSEPLAPFPKKTAQVSLHQTYSETELKFRVCQM